MLRSKPFFLVALAALGLFAAPAGSAGAATITLDTEFDDGLGGQFATVTVTEDAGALVFDVRLQSELGDGADLHKLYFNLSDDVGTLALTTLDPAATDYSLDLDPPVAGGAGSRFDVGVSFGNGAGPSGNGVLQQATFSLAADRALSLADLLELSATSAGIEANLAAHVQGTALVAGSDSETVGGVIVPEPRLAFLLPLLVGALALRRR